MVDEMCEVMRKANRIVCSRCLEYFSIAEESVDVDRRHILRFLLLAFLHVLNRSL